MKHLLPTVPSHPSISGVSPPANLVGLASVPTDRPHVFRPLDGSRDEVAEPQKPLEGRLVDALLPAIRLAEALRDGVWNDGVAVLDLFTGRLLPGFDLADMQAASPLFASSLRLVDLAQTIRRATAGLSRDGLLVGVVALGPGCLLWAGRVPPAQPAFAVLVPPATLLPSAGQPLSLAA